MEANFSCCRPRIAHSIAIEIKNKMPNNSSPHAPKKGSVPMQDSHQSDANYLADRFVQSQMGEIPALFSFPVVVYVGAQMMVLRTPDQMIAALTLYRSIISNEWLALIASEVTADDWNSDGACKISVENRYFATDGRDIGTAKINYYGEGNGAGRKIRMVEYIEWPCADRVAECHALQRLMA